MNKIYTTWKSILEITGVRMSPEKCTVYNWTWEENNEKMTNSEIQVTAEESDKIVSFKKII